MNAWQTKFSSVFAMLCCAWIETSPVFAQTPESGAKQAEAGSQGTEIIPMQWQKLGHGTHRWFAFDLYDATLFSASAPIPVKAEQWPDLALELRYLKNFSGHRIAQASVDEMKKLNEASSQDLQTWGEKMRQIFPDVKAGDKITGVYFANKGIHFFHNRKLLAEINDLKFARQFLSIWLHPQTSAPELRQQLLKPANKGQS